MPTHTIIEFQDTYCNVLQWESSRTTYTLRHVLRVPLEHRSSAQEPLGAARLIELAAGGHHTGRKPLSHLFRVTGGSG